MINELLKRILTSIFLIFLISLSLYLGSIAKAIALFIVIAIAYNEFTNLVEKFYPYPNPSFGAPVTMDIQVINSQTISTKIFNILGKEIWRSTSHYSEPGFTKLIWNGKNNYGAKVSNGIYIVETKGTNKNIKNKIVIIKNN